MTVTAAGRQPSCLLSVACCRYCVARRGKVWNGVGAGMWVGEVADHLSSIYPYVSDDALPAFDPFGERQAEGLMILPPSVSTLSCVLTAGRTGPKKLLGATSWLWWWSSVFE